jgi:cell filamentation protein
LRNHQGITDPAEAERVETRLLAVAYADSLTLPITVKLSQDFICSMHYSWLGDFYLMAGKYRTVNIMKGDIPFCSHHYIKSHMEELEGILLAHYHACFDSASDPRGSPIIAPGLQDSGSNFPVRSVQDIAHSVALVHAELLLIHPFRDGNGRIGRWLADLMVLQAGYAAPAYDLSIPEKRSEYYSAMQLAFKRDPGALTNLFAIWIERGQRQSF